MLMISLRTISITLKTNGIAGTQAVIHITQADLLPTTLRLMRSGQRTMQIPIGTQAQFSTIGIQMKIMSF